MVRRYYCDDPDDRSHTPLGVMRPPMRGKPPRPECPDCGRVLRAVSGSWAVYDLSSEEARNVPISEMTPVRLYERYAFALRRAQRMPKGVVEWREDP